MAIDAKAFGPQRDVSRDRNWDGSFGPRQQSEAAYRGARPRHAAPQALDRARNWNDTYGPAQQSAQAFAAAPFASSGVTDAPGKFNQEWVREHAGDLFGDNRSMMSEQVSRAAKMLRGNEDSLSALGLRPTDQPDLFEDSRGQFITGAQFLQRLERDFGLDGAAPRAESPRMSLESPGTEGSTSWSGEGLGSLFNLAGMAGRASGNPWISAATSALGARWTPSAPCCRSASRSAPAS